MASLVAKFATLADAQARLTLENTYIAQQTNNKSTVYATIINHASDGSACFQVKEDWDKDRVSPIPDSVIDIRDAALLDYEVSAKAELQTKHPTQLAEIKESKKTALVKSAKDQQELSFMSTSISSINSLFDMTTVLAIITYDGANLNENVYQAFAWVAGLWGDWSVRRLTVENATLITDVLAVGEDFTSWGLCPITADQIKTEHQTLIATQLAALPNVPQSIKDIFGLS